MGNYHTHGGCCCKVILVSKLLIMHNKISSRKGAAFVRRRIDGRSPGNGGGGVVESAKKLSTYFVCVVLLLQGLVTVEGARKQLFHSKNAAACSVVGDRVEESSQAIPMVFDLLLEDESSKTLVAAALKSKENIPMVLLAKKQFAPSTTETFITMAANVQQIWSNGSIRSLTRTTSKGPIAPREKWSPIIVPSANNPPLLFTRPEGGAMISISGIIPTFTDLGSFPTSLSLSISGIIPLFNTTTFSPSDTLTLTTETLSESTIIIIFMTC